jgi:hypothetical protein
MELEIIFISFLSIERAYGAGPAISQVVIWTSLTNGLASPKLLGRR